MTAFEGLVREMPYGRLRALMYLYSRGGRANAAAREIVESELKRRKK